MEHAIDRITRIISSLRSSSRLNSDDPMKNVAVGDLFKNLLPLIEGKMISNNVKFTIDDYNPNTKVICRTHQINQILINLLNNAVDALENQEEKEITISFEDHESQFFIIVGDNGPGISAKDQDKIFEALYTTKENGKGTGLGLSISSRLAQENQGSLELRQNGQTHFVLKLKK